MLSTTMIAKRVAGIMLGTLLLSMGGAALWRALSSPDRTETAGPPGESIGNGLDSSPADSTALAKTGGAQASSAANARAGIEGDRRAAGILADPTKPLNERFRLLLDAGEDGDEAASHLALGIVSACHSVEAVPVGTPSLGSETPTEYPMSVHEAMRLQCRGVASDPRFGKTFEFLRKHSAHHYAESVKRLIRERYAAGGAHAALVAGVGALASRPDQITAGVVSRQFAELEISSVYLAPLMRSAESAIPRNRDMLVGAAIQVLACDFGRPCGPDSFDVQLTCLTQGVCIPGASLQTLTFQEQLTGQQARDVQNILANLRQLAP